MDSLFKNNNREQREEKKPFNGLFKNQSSSTNEKKESLMPKGFFDDSEEVFELDIRTLEPFKNHPFTSYSGERLKQLCESIEDIGVITPIIVREIGDDRYEILAGHNRVNACKELGINEVPAIIKDLDDDTALLYVTESNFYQRSFSELKESEKIKAIKLRYDVLKKQKKRNLEEGAEEENTKLELFDLSRRTVYRYLKLNKLVDELIELLDDGKFGVVIAQDIADINSELQEYLSIKILEGNILTAQIAKAIKEENRKGTLTEEKVDEFFTKPEKEKKANVKLDDDIIVTYFKGKSKKEINETIKKLLEEHFKN